MIAFTLDLEWAPEAVIADVLELFSSYGVKCTIFATHDSEVLKNADRNLFEIGIHPNYNPLLAGGPGHFSKVTQKLLDLYPEAVGVRSHSLTSSSPLLNHFADLGLKYDANQYLPYWSGLKPYTIWNGLVRIPFNWEDDLHWTYGYSFDSSRIDLNWEGWKIFNFHPHHIFLNTENEARYERMKAAYHDSEALVQYRNPGPESGVRDLLTSLLKEVSEQQHKTYFLKEIAKTN